MQIINTITQVFEYLLLAYFGFAALYIFIFALAGRFKKSKVFSPKGKTNKIAVLIAAYKEDNVILAVAEKALQQNYPSECYDVVIMADSFLPETLQKLRKMPLRLVEVSFEKSTKPKSLNKGMEAIGDAYDIAVVLDADNVMEDDFLSKINSAYNNGHEVIQAHRAAKNLNTPFAILDAISEEINNHIFRKGHRALGLSSALIGSGMAFDYAFFKKTLAANQAVGGFDKELELHLLKEGITIEYLDDAIVLDEKVQKAEVFNNQRRRWLSVQFIYFQKNFIPGLQEFFLKGNLDYADKVYQMITPPRVLQLGLVTIISAIYLSIEIFLGKGYTAVPANFWYISFTCTVLGLLLAVPAKFYTVSTLRALATLPKSFLLMFKLLFNLRGANKKFIHTTHGSVNP